MTNTKKLLKISPNVKFTQVTGSSLIESYAREAGDLALRLTNGSAYVYKAVPDSVVDGFLSASSKGQYFGRNIRDKFVAEQAE